MARRRRSKSSLYELIKTRPTRGGETDAEPAVLDELDPAGPPAGRWLSPGRVVTLPVGYVLLGLTIATVLVIAAYIVGYGRAERAERRRYEQQLLAQVGPLDGSGRPTDPLLDRPGGGMLGAQEPDPAVPTDSDPGRIARDDRGPGPIESDPRVPGYTYVILMATSREGAMSLAEFCRRHGLETYVVPSNNLHVAFALPGFGPGWSNQDPRYKAHREHIRDIGRLWKEAGGDTDLMDAYPDRYDP